MSSGPSLPSGNASNHPDPESPFARSPGASPRTRRTNDTALMLGAAALTVVFLIVVLSALLFYVNQRVASDSVNLPQGRDYQSSVRRFNASLASQAANPRTVDEVLEDTADPSLKAYLRQLIAQVSNVEEIAVSQEGFIAAASADPTFGDSLGALERYQLKKSLDLYMPSLVLDSFDEFNLLAVRHQEGAKYAEIDFLQGSEAGGCSSHQLYLMKEEAGWIVYDWQRLEFGRRHSSEYAGYFSSYASNVEKFDEAMELLREAFSASSEGDYETAAEKVRAAERIVPMPQDRPEMLLRIAYTWSLIDEPDEALQALSSILVPDQMLGVWPTVAQMHLRKEQPEQALSALKKFEKLSPNHPNLHALRCRCYAALGQNEKASEAAIKALQVCNTDLVHFDLACELVTTQHASQIVDSLLGTFSGDRLETLTLNLRRYVRDDAVEFGKSIVADLRTRNDVPPGLVEAIGGIVADEDGDTDSAITLYLQASDAGDKHVDEFAREQHRYLLERESDYDQLFAQTRDLPGVLRSLALEATYEGLYGNSEDLLPALQKLKDSGDEKTQQLLAANRHWFDALLGQSYYSEEQYPKAIVHLDAFNQWAESDKNTDEETSDLPEYIDSTLRECLLSDGQIQQYIARWPDDSEAHMDLGDSLVQDWRLQDFSIGNRRRLMELVNDESPLSLRLQRLRVQAFEAADADNGPLCNRHHSEVMALADQLNVQAYQLSILRHSRATDLARLQLLPSDLSVGEQQALIADRELLADLLSELNDLSDLPTATAWAENHSQSIEGDLPRLDDYKCQLAYARLLHSKGRYERAASTYLWVFDEIRRRDFYKVTDDVEKSSLRGAYRTAIPRLIDSLINTGKLTEAKAASEKYALPVDEHQDRGLPTEVLTALQLGDYQKAIRSLRQKKQPDDDQPYVIPDYDSQILNHLECDADEEWVATFLELFPDLYSKFRFEQTTALYFSDPGGDLSSIASELLQPIAGVPVSTTQISQPADQSSQTVAYRFRLNDDNSLVASVTRNRFASYQLPADLKTEFEEPVIKLTLSLVSIGPNQAERLINRAASIANDTTLAVQLPQTRRLIWKDNIKDSLRFNQRVPVDGVDSAYIFLKQEEDDDDEPEEDAFEVWSDALSQNSDPIPATMTISRYGTSEALPVLVEGFDSSMDDLVISPTGQSVLQPLVKPGVKLHASPYQVHLQPK